MKDVVSKPKIVVITPVYNDWECIQQLTADVASVLSGSMMELVAMVVVNDNSSVDYEPRNARTSPLHVVNLGINLGHQRAIAVGLCYVADNFSEVDYVVVMDSDGEDLASDIPSLCKLHQDGAKVVFAERKKRSESYFFKIGYVVYKNIFRLMTNQVIKFGNFSSIKFSELKRVVINPDLWNHYSASILKSKLHYAACPTERGRRYFGKSKMNSQNLILHGLSSIAVYADVVIARTLILVSLALALIFALSVGLIWIRSFTTLAIPGWTSNILISLVNFSASLFSIILLLLLIQLNQRRQFLHPVSSFYKNYIISIEAYEQSGIYRQ